MRSGPLSFSAQQGKTKEQTGYSLMGTPIMEVAMLMELEGTNTFKPADLQFR